MVYTNKCQQEIESESTAESVNGLEEGIPALVQALARGLRKKRNKCKEASRQNLKKQV